jgi:hypothetical protein
MAKRTFRLQYASDIHLEFHDRNRTGEISCEMFIKPVADYLALCGDIGFPEHPSTLTFLSWCSRNFKEVYWLPGNHEFYNGGLENKSTYPEKIALCERICNGFRNVHFMNKKVRQVPGWNLRIAGCTMWTKIDEEQDKMVLFGMNDVRQIYVEENKNAMPEDFRRWHTEDKAWLTEEISRAALAQESIIVLTHHLPSYKLVHPKYEGHPLNFCFATDLEQMMVPPVRGWLCGHSHTGTEVTIGDVKCALNPFGYPGEPSTSYSREKVLEITCESHDESSYEAYCCDETCFDECDD